MSLAVLFASCGWESNGPEYLRDAYGTSSCPETSNGNNGSDVTVSTRPATSIAGHWAMEVKLRGITTPIGEDWPITITSLVITEITPDGSAAYIQYCDQLTDVETTSPLRPESHLSEGLKEWSGGVVVPFAKPSLDIMPAMDVLWLWGLHNMKDPMTDPLPTKPDDPLVWDQDEDGKPGVTINITKPIEGDRYIVRRGIWHLGQGTPDKDFLWIKGDLTSKIDMNALGATNQLLKTVAPITMDKDNSYIMRRVPANFTCRDLLSHVDTIFSNPPGNTSGE